MVLVTFFMNLEDLKLKPFRKKNNIQLSLISISGILGEL